MTCVTSKAAGTHSQQQHCKRHLQHEKQYTCELAVGSEVA